MAEKRVIVDGLTVEYEGLFRLNELYLAMEQWLKEKGYDRDETKNYEQVLKTGRDIMIELMPWKTITDYSKIQMWIKISVKEMKDVVVQKDGLDVPMNQGKVTVVFDGYLITDIAGRWEGKPIFYFLRMVFDRWIYRTNTDKWAGAVGEEVDQLYKVVKGHLNMYRF